MIHTVHEGYGPILKLAGNSFYEILTNLDDLHIRVGHTFVNQHPPSFTCKKIDDHTLRLVYRSIREGLSPLVFGLLRGLAKSFNRKVEIEHLIKREAQGYDEFLVKHFPLVETTEQHGTQINHNSITQSNKTVDGKVKCPFSQS